MAIEEYNGFLPNRTSDTNEQRAVNAFNLMEWIVSVFVGSFNAGVAEVEANRSSVESTAATVAQDKADITVMRDIVLDVSNYFGDWVANYSTTENPNGYPTNCAVSFNDEIYYSKVPDNQVQPTAGASDANWFYSGRKDYVLTAVQVANYTSVHYDHVPVDTTAGTFTVNLKANPAEGDRAKISDNAGNCGTNKLIVGRNGQTIMGLAEDYDFTENYQWHEFIFINGTWRIF